MDEQNRKSERRGVVMETARVGRSYLSLPVREMVGFEGAVLIETDDNEIILTQFDQACVLCGNPTTDELWGKGVCRKCQQYSQRTN